MGITRSHMGYQKQLEIWQSVVFREGRLVSRAANTFACPWPTRDLSRCNCRSFLQVNFIEVHPGDDQT
jgi:hypothetical protein